MRQRVGEMHRVGARQTIEKLREGQRQKKGRWEAKGE
jgi:hypothetical protein